MGERTMFQTQAAKAFRTEVAHKDYLLTWSRGVQSGPTAYRQVYRSCRGETAYSPDMTASGQDRQTGQSLGLPTAAWPFEHCGVHTSLEAPNAVKPLRACLICCK